MTSYKAFLARIALVVCASIGGGGAIAQQPTPVEPPSQGRRVSGWMVDSINAQYFNQLPKGDARYSIRGARTDISAAGVISHNPAGGPILIYARAFVKIDEAGPFTLALTSDIKAKHFTGCDVEIRVGKSAIVTGIFNNNRSPIKDVIGNFDLSTGYYSVELMIACDGVDGINVSVAVRGSSDISVRPPRPDELFVVMR